MPGVSIGPRWKTYLMRRIIWRAGRVASWPEESASFVISSVSLPQNPTGLTCPNARSTLTDRLACLRGGGGKRGTWMNGKKSPSSDWQAGRTDGPQFFQAFSGGGSEPLSAPPLTFGGRGGASGLPGALFCLLSNTEEDPPPPSHHQPLQRSPTCAFRCSGQ